MSLLSKLRPAARAPQRPPEGDALWGLTEAAAACDLAALALVEMLERRRQAVRAAIAAGVIGQPLGNRLLSKESVDRALHATGLCDHAGAPRAAAAHRIGFLGQVHQTLNAGKGERHVAAE